MLRGLLATLLFVAFAMPPPASAEALEPDPAGAPFEAEPGAPPPPSGDVQGPGSRRLAGPCRHGRGSRHHFGPQRRFGRDFSFGPGRHGGPYDYSRWFGRGYTRLGRGRGSGPERLLFSERARRKLGLSEEQGTRVHQLGLEARKNSIRRRADLEIKQLELEELLSAAEPDRAAIDRTVQEIGALQAAQMKAGIDLRLGLQDVLTSEQRDKLREFREQGFRGRRSGRKAGKWKHADRPGRPPWAPSEADPPPSPPEQ